MSLAISTEAKIKGQDRREYFKDYYRRNKPTPEERFLLREANRERRREYYLKAKADGRIKRVKKDSTWNPEGKTKKQIYDRAYYLKHHTRIRAQQTRYRNGKHL